MSRRIKELMVKEYTDRFRDLEQRGCVVFDFRGLDANTVSEVRKKLNRHGSDMFVVRNRLMALSLKEMGLSGLQECLHGPSAMVLGTDPVAAAKAVDSVREEYPAVTVLGGYAEGKLLAEPDVKRLADIPDREVLLAQTLGLIMSPAQRFVNGLNNVMARFASVLTQLKEKKEEEGER